MRDCARSRIADSKDRHGLRCCRLREKEKGKEQALMMAACRNMKKTVLHSAELGEGQSFSI
ncbi:hypothetical protein GLW04_07820 [Halobacillus litoralis]|uniref:Transposase DDE domain-containing protein n=1 Tax=Halobacillus litoralis TaxID=45668 RepID=A0A845DSH2_9BACI|nr:MULTISPECIES: hypothetical protein [Halobacillus]MYL19789.1 hypothetical protein [Halobacillus litoralis]MYL28935.1 hypothetical protein [Halobacillus halophilus]MYL37186.1 hypothetical protein [Halobacillus litoralis]